MENIEEIDKKIYEFSYLINSKLSEEEARSFVEKIKGLFVELEGEIVKEPSLEKITLTYPIKKDNMAYFGYFHFSLSPDKIESIKEKIRYEADLTRYLILTPPPKPRRIQDFDSRGQRGASTSSHSQNLAKEEAGEDKKGEEKEGLKLETKESDAPANTKVGADKEVKPVEGEKSEVDGDALEHTLEEIEKIS